MKKQLTGLFFFVSSIGFGQTHTLNVSITGFKNNDGKLYFQVQNPNKKIIYQSIENIQQKTVHVELKGLAQGKYAIRVFHDENNNKKMDTNFVGFPTESWGFSNNVKAKFGPPKFEDSIFELNANKEMNIHLN
jgi:uncharacterized protein (DUF2141 family)